MYGKVSDARCQRRKQVRLVTTAIIEDSAILERAE